MGLTPTVVDPYVLSLSASPKWPHGGRAASRDEAKEQQCKRVHGLHVSMTAGCSGPLRLGATPSSLDAITTITALAARTLPSGLMVIRYTLWLPEYFLRLGSRPTPTTADTGCYLVDQRRASEPRARDLLM